MDYFLYYIIYIWKICGLLLDEITGNWHTRFNRELYKYPVTNFIMGQNIQWLSHIMRSGENGEQECNGSYRKEELEAVPIKYGLI